ncbi:Arginine/lysine/ornithine decarboxylase [Lachnospiraceae bacterium NE2001]|nr:Arginine/lysine/ornithine decarboxylase [Lachnospiraceae bacterium NE2001]
MNQDNSNYILYPVKQFIEEYKQRNKVRLHMPGHKGAFGYSGDITEVTGADSLYEANGIIAESEQKTAGLFGTWRTFYGTEGSSQMIKAMCYLAIQHSEMRKKAFSDSRGSSIAAIKKKRPVILATRNAHKSFIYASMLLGFDIKWIMPKDSHFNLCRCELSPEELDVFIRDFIAAARDNNKELSRDEILSDIAAVYITSPDYLGNILDIKGLSSVAHRYKLPLLVDNAHGAYLRFIGDMHPITEGADITADSAHKTLPVLTGGAYLHIAKDSILLRDVDEVTYEHQIRKALLMFGSTSPSYQILESLDSALGRISVFSYVETAGRVDKLKKTLAQMGFKICGSNGDDNSQRFEPLKLTFDLSDSNVDAVSLLSLLSDEGIECEYADPDYLVTMWSPYNEYPRDFERFEKIMKRHLPDMVSRCSSHKDFSNKLTFDLPEVRFQPYETMYMPHHLEKVDEHLIGKIAADSVISCPPAIAPVAAGEVIDENVVKVLKHYSIEEIDILDMQ